jgi:hypothetical protein
MHAFSLLSRGRTEIRHGPSIRDFWLIRIVLLVISWGLSGYFISQAVLHGRSRQITCEAPTKLFFNGFTQACTWSSEHVYPRQMVGLSRLPNLMYQACYLQVNNCVEYHGRRLPDWPTGRVVSDVYVCPTDTNAQRYTCSLQDASHTVSPLFANSVLSSIFAIMATVLLISSVLVVATAVYRWRLLCRAARMEQSEHVDLS